MIIEKTMSDGWLSNTWLIGDKPGGHGVVIDTAAMTVDEKATQTLRAELRAKRGWKEVPKVSWEEWHGTGEAAE